jgi:hypothetical protein
MDITFAWSDPAMLFLAAGAACLGIGAALIHTYLASGAPRTAETGIPTLKRVLLLSASTAFFVSGPLLILRGL